MGSELDKTPTLHEYRELGEYSDSPIYRLFDSFKTVQKKAGFEPNEKGTTTVICQECGSQFSVTSDRIHTAKFCSRECDNSAHRVTLDCEYCGGQYSVIKSRQEISRFCSKKCRLDWDSEYNTGKNNPNWDGGKTTRYYGRNWAEQRKKALERDKYQCQNCGNQNGRLDVHHIIRFLDFDNYHQANKLSNLITLCVSCHRRVDLGVEPLQTRLYNHG